MTASEVVLFTFKDLKDPAFVHTYSSRTGGGALAAMFADLGRAELAGRDICCGATQKLLISASEAAAIRSGDRARAMAELRRRAEALLVSQPVVAIYDELGFCELWAPGALAA